MGKEGLYTTGKLAKKAGVSIRTIRYYNSMGLIKPSFISEAGYRFYSDEEFVKVKEILALKYLGLSLNDIIEIQQKKFKKESFFSSLNAQKNIITNEINNMKSILNTIETAQIAMKQDKDGQLKDTIKIIEQLENEKEILQRSKDTSKLLQDIELMDKFHTNKIDWYEWVFSNIDMHENYKVLELGCGNGALWQRNLNRVCEGTEIVLTEICDEMLKETENNLSHSDIDFKYKKTDLNELPFEDEHFDVVIANHILFFFDDVSKVIKEIRRVLKHNGKIYCTTIGEKHMIELQEILNGFSQRARLNEDKLAKKFGIENGKDILEECFNDIEFISYKDEFIIDNTDEILQYIYSIPGNILDIVHSRKKEFENYIQGVMEKNKKINVRSQLGMFKATKS
ncbi:MerR family transcriptional regulator [Haloimpatiens sp. FM7315]|uniref:MerR family transcriptional regulator n=1 Tax=Haloimpatiens sp. FM7315 TaxID=3298609 RepID=UPI0035A2E672